MRLSESLGAILGRIWSDADRITRRLVLITLLLVLGASVTAGLAPLLLKAVIDVLERGDASAPQTTLLVIGYAFAHCLRRSLGELRGMFYGRADHSVQRQLSSNLFQHVMSLRLSFHLDRQTGALSQTLANGLLGYRMLLYHLLLTVLPVFVEVATMGAVLLLLDHPEFLVIISLSVLLYTLAFWNGVVRITEPARAASNAHIAANAVLTDSILNYETIKCFCAEEKVLGRFARTLKRVEDEWQKLFIRKMENGLLLATIFTLSLGTSVFVAARAVERGTMSVGEFVLVNAYILQIAQPLEMIGFAFRDIAQGLGFVEKLTELFGQKREPEVAAQSVSLPAGPLRISFAGVSYSYRPDRSILTDIDFVVVPGKTMAIVGASGSGKSTIIRLLLRLIEPTAGQIRLNDIPVSGISTDELRSAIAVVPQDIALFNDTIAYNIGFGKRNSTEAEIVRAAKVARIHDFILGLPDAYATVVGERGLKLSGGEKQRIAIARAVIRQPRVFVFDEATASVDSRTERTMLYNLAKLVRTATTVVIAHRLSTIANADEIMVLDRGKAVERGTHAGLLHRRGTYAAMWQAQFMQQQQTDEHLSVMSRP